jgi:IS1 family transposase
MSSKILEGGIPRRDLEKQQQSQNCEGKKLYYTTSLRSIFGENSGRKRDRSKHPLRGSLRFSDGKSCVCTPFCFLDERGEEIPIIFENAFEVVRAFCSKNQTQENDDGARERMGAHILENVVIRTWRMRATTPQENRSGRCNKRKQSDEHSDSISHRKNNEEKEGEKEERIGSRHHLEALSFEIVQPSSEMESDSALLESETQNISNANGGVDEDSQVILMKAEKSDDKRKEVSSSTTPSFPLLTTTQNGSVRLASMEELRANGRLDVVDDAVRVPKKASHRLSIGIVDDMESGGIDVNHACFLKMTTPIIRIPEEKPMFFALFLSAQSNSKKKQEDSKDKMYGEQWIMFQGERMMAFHPLLACTSSSQSCEDGKEERNDGCGDEKMRSLNTHSMTNLRSVNLYPDDPTRDNLRVLFATEGTSIGFNRVTRSSGRDERSVDGGSNRSNKTDTEVCLDVASVSCACESCKDGYTVHSHTGIVTSVDLDDNFAFELDNDLVVMVSQHLLSVDVVNPALLYPGLQIGARVQITHGHPIYARVCAADGDARIEDWEDEEDLLSEDKKLIAVGACARTFVKVVSLSPFLAAEEDEMLEMKHLLNVCADVKPTIRSSLNGMRALTFKKNVRVSSSRRDTLRSLCDSLGFGLAFETLNAFDALWKRLPSMKSGTSSERQVRDVLTVAREPDQMCLTYLSGIVPGTTNAKEDYEQITNAARKMPLLFAILALDEYRRHHVHSVCASTSRAFSPIHPINKLKSGSCNPVRLAYDECLFAPRKLGGFREFESHVEFPSLLDIATEAQTMLSRVTVARETLSPLIFREGAHRKMSNVGVNEGKMRDVHVVHGYDARLPRGHVLRISAARAFCIEKAKREKASLLIAHLERTRDSRFNRDRFTLNDASGSVPIEFEFEDVGLDDVAAYFGELERKIEESPTTYLVALTAWRTLCEGIERDNTGCDDDAFAHSRTRICARLNDIIFLDERIFAHSQNNICASQERCISDQNAISIKQALFWSAKTPSHYGSGALCEPTPTDIDVRGVVVVEQRVTGDAGAASATFGNHRRRKQRELQLILQDCDDERNVIKIYCRNAFAGGNSGFGFGVGATVIIKRVNRYVSPRSMKVTYRLTDRSRITVVEPWFASKHKRTMMEHHREDCSDDISWYAAVNADADVVVASPPQAVSSYASECSNALTKLPRDTRCSLRSLSWNSSANPEEEDSRSQFLFVRDDRLISIRARISGVTMLQSSLTCPSCDVTACLLSKPSSLYITTDNTDLCKATETCFKQKASPVFQLELNVTIDDGTGVADCWISNSAATGLLPEKMYRDIVTLTRKHGKVVARTSTSTADERENYGALDFGYSAIGYQGYTLSKVDARPIVEAIKYVNATPHMLFECARNYKVHSHPQYGDTFCAYDRPSIFARNMKCGGFPMRTVCAPGGRLRAVRVTIVDTKLELCERLRRFRCKEANA